MYYCGIDIGSRSSKIVALNAGKVLFSKIVETGVQPHKTARNLLNSAQEALALDSDDQLKIVTTGYGRKSLQTGFKTISEISCHAQGVFFSNHEAEIVIDIGGQDSKGILLGKEGKVLDFVMNDRCAAGSGRFLEKVADILDVKITELADLAAQSSQAENIDSTCVVFAESEIISLLAKGSSPADIAKGVHNALAKRIRNLLAPLPDRKNIVFTGGVARNQGMKHALENTFNQKIIISANPVLTGALGAALYAKKI